LSGSYLSDSFDAGAHSIYPELKAMPRLRALQIAAASIARARTPLHARADDYGPHAMLRDLRGSAPVLLPHFLAAPIVMGDAVIEGDEAIVMWQSAGKPGLATFHRRNDRWWLIGVFDLFGPAVTQPQEWAQHLSISPALVARAEQHVAGFDTKMPTERAYYQAACARCGSKLWNFTDGFETTLTFDAATPSWDPAFAIRGRAPTVAEMPPTPHMNAYYFFSIVTKGTQPVVLKDATLDVWFPYVLDAKGKYALLLGFVDPNIEDIAGTLSGNTLHFTFPAFATIPGKDALGEIDGDFP
jgi:hypothetical protein